MHTAVTLILIRHAQTKENKKGAYIGCGSDVHLSPDGEVRAKNEGEYLRSVSGRNIELFVSPMQRCKATADIIWPDEKQIIIDELKEMDFGEFEGLSYDDLNGNDYYQRWIDSGGTLPFPGGEDRMGYISRTMKGFDKMLGACTDDDNSSPMFVAVVHGGTIMAIMSSLTGRDYYDFRVENLHGYKVEISLDDGAVTTLSYDFI